MSCGVGCRFSSDPVLLWLWLYCRLAATAPIRPLSWEPPYAAGVALKKTKDKKKKNPYICFHVCMAFTYLKFIFQSRTDTKYENAYILRY